MTEASVTWHSVDLRSGRRGPQVTVQGEVTLKRILGEATDLSDLAVRCWDAATETPEPGWETATLPGATMLVAIDELNVPVWGGMVVRRRSDETEWVSVDVVTLEAYFDRRYVTDHDFTATQQGAIIDAILTADVIPTGVEFIVDANSATLRDRTYFDDEDKTVLSILQELMGVDGGPEFTVDLEWANPEQTILNRIVRVRDRIGTSAELPVQFLMPGPVVAFTYTEDYTSENGANDVMASSSGEGDARPVSEHQVAQDYLDGGWPRYEYRFTPSTSITDTTTLDAHAASTLAEMKDGLNELTMEAHLDTAPRFGSDFHLGDDLTAVLTCPRFPERVGPDGDLVPGYSKTVRCIGVEVDYGERRLRPITVEVA